jgi:hypothetical protein
MDKLYPAHAKALQTANLVPNIFPTLGKILDNRLSMMQMKRRTTKTQEPYDFA